MTYPVSQTAVVRRVNRRLKPQGQKLLRTRGQRASREIGRDWFILNSSQASITGVELESTARRLGVLGIWERLAKPEGRA
jgi:hypothetical protein